MNIVSALIDLLTSLFGVLSSGGPAKAKALPATDDDPWDEKDYWYDWKGIDAHTFWQRIITIEDAAEKGPEALDAAAREQGLPGTAGYRRVKATFVRHHGNDTAFNQAAMDVRTQQMQGWMNNAAANEDLLAPIEGVSCEQWATVAAKLSRLGNDPAAYHKLLAEEGLDPEKFERVQRDWTTRMRSATDPMGAAAIAQVYGKAFSATTSGSFSQQAAGGAEPCSLERYAEIMGAQGAWHDEGRDIHALLQSTFGISAVDFSDIGTYWMNRTMKDVSLATRVNELSESFRKQYRTMGDADADLVF